MNAIAVKLRTKVLHDFTQRVNKLALLVRTDNTRRNYFRCTSRAFFGKVSALPLVRLNILGGKLACKTVWYQAKF